MDENRDRPKEKLSDLCQAKEDRLRNAEIDTMAEALEKLINPPIVMEPKGEIDRSAIR